MTAPLSPSPMAAGREPTLLDVARDAGVSRATASRVLSGSSRVSPQARQRVVASAERLRYQVNAAARSLRTARTGLVGLLIPGYRNDLYGPIADRLDARLRDHDLSVIIGSSDWSTSGDLRILSSFAARRLDGMVLAPSNDRSPGLAALLGSLNAPVVLLDREVAHLERDRVLTGLSTAVEDAMGRLADHGHRRIAVTAYGPHLRPGRQVRHGFAAAVERYGLDDDPALLVGMSGLEPGEGVRVADQLLHAKPTAAIIGGPTALMATCLRRIRQVLGSGSIPDRLSIVVVGDETVADLHDPELDLVSRPIEAIAAALARTLLLRMDEPSVSLQSTTIDLQYRPGASVSSPPL